MIIITVTGIIFQSKYNYTEKRFDEKKKLFLIKKNTW